MEGLNDFLNAMGQRASLLSNVYYVLGGAASSTLALQKRRIFADGLRPDGTEIGVYSPEYLERREKEFNRQGTRVILTATAQMRNDYTVVVGLDFVGIGFQNPFNAEKAEKNEKRYKSAIFSLSEGEKRTLLELTQKRVKDVLLGTA